MLKRLRDEELCELQSALCNYANACAKTKEKALQNQRARQESMERNGQTVRA